MVTEELRIVIVECVHLQEPIKQVVNNHVLKMHVQDYHMVINCVQMEMLLRAVTHKHNQVVLLLSLLIFVVLQVLNIVVL